MEPLPSGYISLGGVAGRGRHQEKEQPMSDLPTEPAGSQTDWYGIDAETGERYFAPPELPAT